MKVSKRNIREAANAKRQRRKQQLITIVKDGWSTVRAKSLEVGIALTELRDDDHWKDTHTSFYAFGQELFGISESYITRLVKSAEVVKDLPPSSRSQITTESQTRELSAAPKEARPAVLEEASKNGHPTASKISAAREVVCDKMSPPIGGDRVSIKSGSKPMSPEKNEKPSAVLDCIGTPIPEEALPFWNRRKEVQDLMTRISEVKCAVEKAKLSNDMLYGGVSNNFVVEMRSAYAHIKDGALPHAVCTQCQGIPSMQETGCSFCNSTGLIPEWKWNTQSIKEVKEMRIKIAADLAAGRLK